MILTTERLILRPWREEDAESMFEYAKDPDVGYPAGWRPHSCVDESLKIIRTVFSVPENYAICKRDDDIAIGSIGLKFGANTDMTDRDDECEMGFCLGKRFWGRGYVPEAALRLLDHAFSDLGIRTVFCGYYEGNDKSKRAQEKIGFAYSHFCDEVPVPALGVTRGGYTNYMTREMWNEIRRSK